MAKDRICLSTRFPYTSKYCLHMSSVKCRHTHTHPCPLIISSLSISLNSIFSSWKRFHKSSRPSFPVFCSTMELCSLFHDTIYLLEFWILAHLCVSVVTFVSGTATGKLWVGAGIPSLQPQSCSFSVYISIVYKIQ